MHQGLPQLSKMKSFAVIINFQPSIIIVNFSILDVCRVLGYVSGKSPLQLKVSSIYFCQTRYFQQSRNL